MGVPIGVPAFFSAFLAVAAGGLFTGPLVFGSFLLSFLLRFYHFFCYLILCLHFFLHFWLIFPFLTFIVRFFLRLLFFLNLPVYHTAYSRNFFTFAG